MVRCGITTFKTHEVSDMIPLTVGMATYDDYDGTVMSVQALRLTNDKDTLARCELVVVDNNPSGPHGEATRKFMEWVKPLSRGGEFAQVRYVPFPSPVGTSAPRQHLFDVADGESVLCMDSHVMLVHDALWHLLNHFHADPNSKDLLSGPMLYDDLLTYSSHMADEWSDKMWGTWQNNSLANDLDDPPFEVPMMGLGLFACRKSVWAHVGGFNSKFRGFGGEEGYIHEKFRQHGGKCVCLPFLRWWHRFNDNRPTKPNYPNIVEQRVRNCVIGHRELGIPLDRCREHFLSVGMNARHFDAIVDQVDGKSAAVLSCDVPGVKTPDWASTVQFSTSFGQGYHQDSVTKLDGEDQ